MRNLVSELDYFITLIITLIREFHIFYLLFDSIDIVQKRYNSLIEINATMFTVQ
jgi:hypothetical protein